MKVAIKGIPFALAAVLAVTAALATEAHSAAATNPGFEKMKSLVGEWVGVVDEGGKKMPSPCPTGSSRTAPPSRRPSTRPRTWT